jgi:threonine dehydrogenase-like Zn-dependent dehydrogenase
MKALAWFAANDVRMIEAPVPDITEPDDVIVKVTGTTICGSDLHLYHGEILDLRKGDILGHEVKFLMSSPTIFEMIFPVHGESGPSRSECD